MWIILLFIIRAHTLWPRPFKSQFGSDSLIFSSIEFSAVNVPSHFAYAWDRLTSHYQFQPQPSVPFKCIYQTSPNDFQLETSEKYTLQIDDSGIRIESETVFGCMRGLSTLHQLIQTKNDGYVIENIPILIEDIPKYPHRGVLVDTSRHFIPVPILIQILEGMFLSKLNVLHWHMVDATSFPFHSKRRPELAEKGAFSKEEQYSPEDVTRIVDEARSRGIRVMIEFDTPGHVWSIGQGAPHIVKCNAVEDQHEEMCPGPPCAFLDLSHQDTFPIVSEVIDELIDLVPGNYFHLGGDEVGLGCYEDYKGTREWFKKLQDLIAQKNRSPAFWHDGIQEMKISVDKDKAILVNWATQEKARELVDEGYRIVQMPNTNLFLDCGFGNYISGDASWCDPHKTWQTIYAFDPIFGIPAEKQPLVLGAQAAMWTEMTAKETIIGRIFPRASALGEVLWSGADLNAFSHPTQNAMVRFLKFREFMLGFDLPVAAPTTTFCLYHPEYCTSFLKNVYESSSESLETNANFGTRGSGNAVLYFFGIGMLLLILCNAKTNHGVRYMRLPANER